MPDNHRPVRFVSLFTGAGGLDLGLEAASARRGFATALAVEVDKKAQATLRSAQDSGFFRDSFEVVGDVRLTRGRDLLAAIQRKRGDLELLVGGPPCPSFSTAGKRQSINDARGELVLEFLRVIRETRPRFFIMENVRGLLSAALRHRPLELRTDCELHGDERLGSVLEMLLLEIDKLKYQVVYGKANAANFGSPQLRHRAIFIGSRDREFPRAAALTDLMARTHSESPANESALPWRTLQDALRTMPPSTSKEFNPYSPERERLFRLIPPGANWRYLRDHLSRETAERALGGAWTASGGRVGFYRRLSWDRPAPTLVTSPIQKATGFCHPEETRPLTVAEYARVQEFPDEYPFQGSISQRYAQIGNAVPLSLGVAIGRALTPYLDD